MGEPLTHNVTVLLKRWNGGDRTALNELLLALDEALNRLASFDERKSRVIELRFFGGLSPDEIASTLHVSVPTVVREARMAEAWRYRDLA